MIKKKITNKRKGKEKDRLGETRLNSLGSKMWIVKYIKSINMMVQFEDGYVTKTTYQHFLNGNVKNPNNRSIFGVGYLGIGDYQVYIKGKAIDQYISWKAMFSRCYNSKFQVKRPTYIGCTICDEWLNFQNFAKWYNENFYQIEGQTMALDKDILQKNNRVYSPSTCVYVPENINNLFIKSNSSRGEFPIGVSSCEDGKYKARCSVGKGKSEYLGLFNTPELAFQAYKSFKEQIIKEVANTYKNKIPQKLYDVMMKYEVDIDD